MVRDELKAVEPPPSALPPVLRRIGQTSRILEPPPRVQGIGRELYPIRMTLALVAMILYVVQAVVLVVLGERTAALLVLLALVPMIAIAWLARLDWPRLAIAIGTTLTFGLQLSLHLAYGRAAGAWLFSIPIALAAYQIHAPEDWPQRLVPVTYALVGIVLPIAFPDLRPWHVLDTAQLHIMFAINLLSTLYAVFVLSSHAAVVRDHARTMVARERDRADALLHNILPAPIVKRLKAHPGVIADSFDQVTVLFADIVGFTPLSAQLSSEALVALLNDVFSAFDALATRHGLEKIKTIGDAYMLVCGLPEPRADHAEAAVRMALDMRQALADCAARSGHALELRIGIHSGAVVAGVIGAHKFAYDLWGDTVNVASRMESHGKPGAIHISDATRALLTPTFELEDRGPIAIKGKGEMRTWFVRGVNV